MPDSEVELAGGASSQKRQPRQSRLVKAALSCERLGRFDVTLRNISLNGVGGKSPLPLDRGERVTLFMPGHDPMAGTVRWVAGERFGIETDVEIEPVRLRAAHGDDIIPADARIDFQIVPPPQFDTWRPGLRRTTAQPGSLGPKR